MPLNLSDGNWTQIKTCFLSCNLLICLLKKTFESHTQQLVLGVVFVILLRNILLFYFVLKLSCLHTATPYSLKSKVINTLLLFRSNLVCLTMQLLLVVCILETPLNILCWGLFKMLFYMEERMLRDISNTKIMMNEEFAFTNIGWLGIP